MEKKLLVIGCLGVALLITGCSNEKNAALKKMKSRAQAESTIKETQKLEDDMRKMQELERVEKQTQKVVNLQEPAQPPAE